MLAMADRGVHQVESHLAFVSRWFPSAANSALHVEVARCDRLASRVNSRPTQFGSIAHTLDQIRSHVGLDHSQIAHFTSATITVGVPGTIIFFTVDEPVPLQRHLKSGGFPVNPEVHQFQQRRIYHLPNKGSPLGLYSADGVHFVLGDWEVFKTTLLGNAGRLSELAKILSAHAAPIIICSNPRRAGKRFSKDDPFGNVISIDFDDEKLAFLMQEEQPTPETAAKRLGEMKVEMPKAFQVSYGMFTKQGVRYLSDSDGRYVTFAAQAPISVSSKLLAHLMGGTIAADRNAAAAETAEATIELFGAARKSSRALAGVDSSRAVIDRLCAGVKGKDGTRFQLPFLTGVERERVAARLVLEGGNLALAPEVEPEVQPAETLDEKQIRRHALLIATLTMSAAAAESPGLRRLKKTEEIIEAICSTGFRGGAGFEKESFKGPELSSAEIARVAEFLEPSEGYLILRR